MWRMEPKQHGCLISFLVLFAALLEWGAATTYQTYNGYGTGFQEPRKGQYGYSSRGYSPDSYSNRARGSTYGHFQPLYQKSTVSTKRGGSATEPYISKPAYTADRYSFHSKPKVHEAPRYETTRSSSPYRKYYPAEISRNEQFGNQRLRKGDYGGDLKRGQETRSGFNRRNYHPETEPNRDSSTYESPWKPNEGRYQYKYATNPYIEKDFVKTAYKTEPEKSRGYTPRRRIYGKSASGSSGQYEDIDLVYDSPTEKRTYYGQVAPSSTRHYKRGEKTYSRRHDPCVELSQGNYVLDSRFQKLFPYVDRQCYFIKCANKKAYLNPCSRATRNDKDGSGFCSHLDLAGYCGFSIHDTGNSGYDASGAIYRER